MEEGCQEAYVSVDDVRHSGIGIRKLANETLGESRAGL